MRAPDIGQRIQLVRFSPQEERPKTTPGDHDSHRAAFTDDDSDLVVSAWS